MPPHNSNTGPGVVFLDFDGTVVDTAQLVFNIYHQRMIPEITMDIFKSWYNNNCLEGSDNCTCKRRRETSRVEIDRCYRTRLLDTVGSEKSLLVPGIERLIKELPLAQKETVIVSSASEVTIEEYLTGLNLIEHITAIKGHESGYSKTSKIIEYCTSVGKSVRDSTMITDTSGDIKAARDARVGNIFAMTWGFHPLQTLNEAHPTKICNDLSGLRQTLGLVETESVLKCA